MAPTNHAAWSRTPKGDLEIKEAPFYDPQEDEILIKNEAIAIQPFDARVRRDAYIKISYPFILGSSLAGTVVAIGSKVSNFEVGDRVVSDTPVYQKHETRFGGWQQYVVGKASLSAKIHDVPFPQAAALSFPLQTAVAALHLYLGMERPGERPSSSPEEKVLIWGAGGAVGAYAVQYAKSVGYTVIATASPRSIPHLLSLGATTVLPHTATTTLPTLQTLAPFTHLFTTSGDPASQTALAALLQPTGGRFASTLGGEVSLPVNVTRVYEFFGNAALKEGKEFGEFGKWWYGEYLGKVIREGLVEPVEAVEMDGGLRRIQEEGDRVLEGRVRGKVVLNPQE